jgi:hypothetical protein
VSRETRLSGGSTPSRTAVPIQARVGCHTRCMQAGFLRCVAPSYGLRYQPTTVGIIVSCAVKSECFIASFGLR